MQEPSTTKPLSTVTALHRSASCVVASLTVCAACSAQRDPLPPVSVAVSADASDGDGNVRMVDSAALADGVTADAGRRAPGADAAGNAAFAPDYCAKTCATAAADSCLRMDVPPAGDCMAYCSVHMGGWTPSVGEAFAACVANEPLCFEKLDDCILRKRYPDGVTAPVTCTVSGLDAYNGKTLRVWHDPGKANPFGQDQLISGGQVALSWSVPLKFLNSEGVLLLMYVDVDGDGQCSAAKDLTHSGYATWTGDIRAPAFSLTVMAAQMNDAAFVCGVAP